MSGSEQEGKGEAIMVSIPLSSDEEIPVGATGHNSSQQGYNHAGRDMSGTLQGLCPPQALPSNSIVHIDNLMFLLSDNFSVVDDVTEDEKDEADEKNRLISQVLELQNDFVMGSGQYIENLMSASSVFQPANPDSKKRPSPSKPGAKKGEKR
ncbi:hypothetical protein OS493_025867 [Desmophyllum pertusum]|uniref:Uncharacterized protein n=1 Tax=Desmophyllum pertusum TaxID=174260 RepID=A0A9W9YXU6_9CNID|nr:hypothetical protein OS493_025867 [Desmophyllum pertusum]